MKAEIWGIRYWVPLTDPATIRQKILKELRESGFGIVGHDEHHFEPQGYSAVWLLAESHLAVHTWPEEGTSLIELTSCNLAKLKTYMERVHEPIEYYGSHPGPWYNGDHEG